MVSGTTESGRLWYNFGTAQIRFDPLKPTFRQKMRHSHDLAASQIRTSEVDDLALCRLPWRFVASLPTRPSETDKSAMDAMELL
jgi:hypothetical protein